jgi:hypothetical protein
MAPIAALLLASLTAVACNPGPAPQVAGPSAGANKNEHRRDRFPTDSQDPFPLDQAIRSGRLADVQRLLEQGANPNLRWGESGDQLPLQEVLDSGGRSVTPVLETVSLLLAHGADPNARWCPFQSRAATPGRTGCHSMRGSTALMFAAASGQGDVVELLLAAGADAAAEDWMGGSALDYAMGELTFEHIGRALFPTVETRDRLALDYLRRDGSSTSAVLLRALQPNHRYVPAAPWPATETLLIERVRTLLAIGVDPNESIAMSGSGERRPVITVVLTRQYYRVARVLVQGGANVNQRWCGDTDQDCVAKAGRTPLMSAAEWGDAAAVAILLELNADRSLKDWAGRTALDYASTGGMRELLAAGR